jgi:hypothetical protein
MTLVCPQGFACTVECGGSQSCHLTTIVCPDTYACTILCDATKGQTCQGAIVDCSPTGPCNLHCGVGPQACITAMMSCGQNACQATCTGPDLPAVACGSACSCKHC